MVEGRTFSSKVVRLLVLELVVESVIDFSLRESSKNWSSFAGCAGVMSAFFGAGLGRRLEAESW